MAFRPILGLFALVACAFAQPAFEVAAIKPADPNANGSSTHSNFGRITMENVSLKDCIERAFSVKNFSLSGPPWLDSARFNIVAKPPDGTPREQFNAMLQTLLADRFKLAFHRETKVMPAYALLVEKKGLKVQPVETGPDGGWSTGRGRADVIHITMPQIADFLSQLVDRPVKDMTGVAGRFDFKLRWTPEGADPATADPSVPSSIFTALQEIAGLKLEPQRLPIEILVVDRIDRQPTEN